MKARKAEAEMKRSKRLLTNKVDSQGKLKQRRGLDEMKRIETIPFVGGQISLSLGSWFIIK